jgi:hypothetical protein
VTPEAIAAWMPAATGRRGRPRRYSDIAIETGLMLRLAFGRPWRQTEGMLGSIMDLLGLELSVPEPDDRQVLIDFGAEIREWADFALSPGGQATRRDTGIPRLVMMLMTLQATLASVFCVGRVRA